MTNRGRFSTAGSDSSRLMVYPVGSNEGRVLYTRASSADPAVRQTQWSSDSRYLFFKSVDADGRASFWSVSLDGGTRRLLARLDDLSRPSYRTDFSVAGQRIYFAVNDRQSDISVVELISGKR